MLLSMFLVATWLIPLLIFPVYALVRNEFDKQYCLERLRSSSVALENEPGYVIIECNGKWYDKSGSRVRGDLKRLGYSGSNGVAVMVREPDAEYVAKREKRPWR